MKLERFADIVDAYGADAARWPEGERLAALALLETVPEAARLYRQALALDSWLDESCEARLPDALFARVEALVPAVAASNTPAPSNAWWRGGWLRWFAPPVAAMAMGLLAGVVVPPPLATTIGGTVLTASADDTATDALLNYGIDLGYTAVVGEESLQ
jgi:hypothetical protein